MRPLYVLVIAAAIWTVAGSTAWALPQCLDEPTRLWVRGWSASGDRVALHREVYQPCSDGTRRDVLEIYEKGGGSPVACFDGFSADPSVPTPCDQVTFIGEEAWGGADVFANTIPLPEGFVESGRSLSTRGATLWATNGEDSTAYTLEVFPPDPAASVTLPLVNVPMFDDPWMSGDDLEVMPLSVSVSVAPGGRRAAVLLAYTERDDDLEYQDMGWAMIELPEGVPLAAPEDRPGIRPTFVRCAPDEDEQDRPMRPWLRRTPAKARVYQRVGNLARALSMLSDATNALPGFVSGWAARLDVVLAEGTTVRAASIARRLQASCPALAAEVMAPRRFDGLRAREPEARRKR